MGIVTIVEVVFWGCLGMAAYTYFAYPLTIRLLAYCRRDCRKGGGLPSVSLIVSAYNEEAILSEKLENSTGLDYPASHLETLVISDASDDGTDAVAKSYHGRGVVLFRQESRRGKSAGLTRFVPQAGGEILVFSDANSMYQPNAIRMLVRHFADPQVGFVIGHQRYLDDISAASQSESLYWRYETWLKVNESKVGSVVCGDGAMLAMRAELFEPLRDDDINDSYLPLRIVARGYRGLLDPEAVCYERTANDFWGEFRRRARIVNRAFGAVLRVPQVLNPFRVGLFAYQVLFHRVLRWLVPFFMVAMLLSSAYLAAQNEQIYAAMLALQLLFYGTALLALVPGVRQLKPVYITSYFCVANAAAALGVIRLMLGKRVTTWHPERGQSRRSLQPSDVE